MRGPRFQYCPRCAERLAPGLPVCPMCGETLPAETPAERPRTAARLLSGALALIFTALLFFSVALLPVLDRTPRERFIKYNFHLIPEPEAAGTYTLTVSSEDRALSNYLRGSRITLSYSLRPRGLVLNAGVDLMSSPVLSAALTFDGTYTGVCVPQVKDVYYVAGLTELLSRLGLIFPDETDTRPPSITGTIALISRYRAVFRTFVRDDELCFQEDVPVTLSSGEEIRAGLYTFTPSPQALRSFLRTLSDTLDRDRDLLALFTYFADLSGSVIPARAGREMLADLSDYFYDRAEAWSRLLETPLTWTLAVEGGRVRLLTARWGELGLTLEPTGDGADIRLSHPEAPILEDLVFHLRYAPGEAAVLPEAPREDITNYSVLRLLSLVRELRGNIGEDILYAFGDILEILGL